MFGDKKRLYVSIANEDGTDSLKCINLNTNEEFIFSYKDDIPVIPSSTNDKLYVIPNFIAHKLCGRHIISQASTYNIYYNSGDEHELNRLKNYADEGRSVAYFV